MRFTCMIELVAKWQILLVCGLLTVAFMWFFSSADRAAPEGTPGIIELEVAFSADKFSDIVQQWSKASTLQLQKRNLWIDLLFPIAYSSFLSGLHGALAIRTAQEPSQGVTVLLALPIVAGLLDWIENGLLLMLLRDITSFSVPLVFLASTAASIKWILILVSALAIVYHSVRRIAAFARRSTVDGG